MSRRAAMMIGLMTLLTAAACDREMADQPRYETYDAGALFPNFRVMRHPVPGTVARGELAVRAALDDRPVLSMDLLTRGRRLYDAFCTPCHDPAGTGRGVIVARGMPQPPSFHTARIRQAPDAHVLKVIAEGYGVMYGYGARIRPADRWAILGYVRALQLSGHVSADALPEPVRASLLRDAGP